MCTFFCKRPRIVAGFTAQNLEQLKPGMSAKDAVALVGEPGFAMDTAAAFIMLGSVPAWAKGKENWVYRTPYGEFQLIVQDKKTVVEVKFVQGVLEKMRGCGGAS